MASSFWPFTLSPALPSSQVCLHLRLFNSSTLQPFASYPVTASPLLHFPIRSFNDEHERLQMCFEQVHCSLQSLKTHLKTACALACPIRLKFTAQQLFDSSLHSLRRIL
jgi:hypothetical protein